MAGDPNKIEGEDFKAMKTNSGLKVEKAFLGKLFGKKSSTAQPSNQKTVNSTTGMGMGKLIPHLLQQAKSDGTIKANSGLEVDADILGNRLDKKMTKYLGSKETELHAGYKGDYKEDSGEDRAEKRALKEVMQEAGIKFTGAKYGKMIMARGCKMGKNKPTKLS
jgi:uncharacterized protein involved in outer membrane biogenesis